MISNTAKRAILLILGISILGYVYGEPSEVQEYGSAVRFVFVPIIFLSGFWIYSEVVFAVIGVAAWLGAYFLSGPGAAVLSQGRALRRAEGLVDDSCAAFE